MDTCAICQNSAEQLFETGQDGVFACSKCQPLVPEVTIEDNSNQSLPQSSSEQESESQHTCKICHKTFQKNMQLQSHMRNHRAERRFVCTYCNKAFSQSNNLRAHLRIHTNERPFKCSECGKAFTQVTNLNNHVRLHTGERPFVCPEPGCDKAYAQVTNLNQHRKRHLSGRSTDVNYDCSICGAHFLQRNHMYIHRREEHGEVPVRLAGAHCKNCNLSFSNHRMLQQHAATDHSHAPDHTIEIVDDDNDKEGDGDGQGEAEAEGEREYPCVFSSCGMRFASPAQHTEHLLAAHQLRVLAKRGQPPNKRGRPPKAHYTPKNLQDPLEIKQSDFPKVKVLKQGQYLPKLKIQSLFHAE